MNIDDFSKYCKVGAKVRYGQNRTRSDGQHVTVLSEPVFLGNGIYAAKVSDVNFLVSIHYLQLI